MKQYDLTVLSNPVTQADIDAVRCKTVKPFNVGAVTAIGGVITAAAMLLGPIMALPLSLTSGRDLALIVSSLISPFATVLIVTAGIAGLAVFVNKGIRSNANRLARIHKFANINGLTYASEVTSVGLKGMIFDEGRSRKMTEMLTFPDGFEIGNYQYVTGSGKSTRSHIYGYVRVALKRPLPNMVLDAKSNNFMNLTNLPDVFHASQKLELEGDFNKYFDLYVPKQYEQDALYVFTPDVMQTLIDSGRKLDMEVVDDELFVYQPAPFDLSSQSVMERLLLSVDAISSELKNQTKRYSDERVVVPEGTAPVVADQGKRLKQSFNWSIVAIVVVFFSIQLASAFLPKELILPLLSIGGIAFWGVVLYVVVKTIRRRTDG